MLYIQPRILCVLAVVCQVLHLIRGQDIIKSSLETNRNYTCPDETVSYSCVTRGTRLHWEINGAANRLSFSTSTDDFIQYAYNIPCYFIVGILVNPNIMDSYCYSTLFVTFGRLNESRTSVSMDCANADYVTLNITCAGDRSFSPLQQHKVAGVPTSDFINENCSYTRNGNNISFLVELEVPRDMNTDLDYYKLYFHQSIEQFDTRYFFISDSKDGMIQFTGEFGVRVQNQNNYYVRATAFDKCNQQSEARRIKCILSKNEDMPGSGFVIIHNNIIGWFALLSIATIATITL